MVESFKGKKVTIMGLGLHGGGLASALFFLKEGATLTVTDLRSENVLKPTMDLLKDYKVKYTLKKHIDEDFTGADLVIKNPGVPSSSKYLKLAKRVETDISIFLQRVHCPIIAITGSKGKSSTVCALDFVLKKHNPRAKLGGNITVSPLTFIQDVDETTPVVLELSSWQLADLKNRGCLKPKIAAITNIMNDHQNAYNSLENYAYDKSLIFQNIDGDVILNFNDKFTPYFKDRLLKTTKEEPLYFSNKLEPNPFNGAYIDDMKQGWLQIEGQSIKILDQDLTLKGEHQRENLLLAGLILFRFGLNVTLIRESLKEFKGIAHRMELFLERDGIAFYNDSAATIPEAVCAAIESFKTPVRLICGGTDKELKFECIVKPFNKPTSIHLLSGTGTDKMVKVLDENNISYNGPYDSLKLLIEQLMPTLNTADSVLFSPGATSFGMFNNEFDRGNQFKEMITIYRIDSVTSKK